jgi:hypothetical protein
MPPDFQPVPSPGLPVVYGKLVNGRGHTTRLEPNPGGLPFADSAEEMPSNWELAWIDLGGEG